MDFAFWMTLLTILIWISLSLVATGGFRLNFGGIARFIFVAFFSIVPVSILFFMATFFWAFLLHIYVKQHVKPVVNRSYWSSYAVYVFGSLLPENLAYILSSLIGKILSSGLLPLFWLFGILWTALNLVIGGAVLFETTRKKMVLAALLYLVSKFLLFRGNFSLSIGTP